MSNLYQVLGLMIVQTHTQTHTQGNKMQKKFYNWQYFSGQEILSSRMRKNSEPGQKKVGLARSRQNLHKGVVVE